jgi:hypothetical protein
MVRLASALLLVALVLAGCIGGGEDTIPESAGERLVLLSADLPAVFIQFDGGKLVLADFLPGPREDPERFGRLSGWKARFKRGGDAKTAGPLIVESRADLFEDSADADQDLEAYREQFEEARASSPRSSRLLDVAGLGEEAAGFTLRQPGSPAVRHISVAWRNRNATASISVSGFEGKLALGSVLALARKQERRIAVAAD